MLEKLHDEMLTEAYVMSLFGLDPKEEKDIEHMAYLRGHKRIPHCSVTHRVRVYPRQALSDWLVGQLKTGPTKKSHKPKEEKETKAKKKRAPKTEPTPKPLTEEPATKA